MDIVNVEIKASVVDLEHYHDKLLEAGADYKGVDRQIDTYYRVNCGRLKLRQGTIEHSLIFYQRPESKDLKQSAVILNKLKHDSEILHRQLEASLGIKAKVDKQRRIYFIDNVKFHLDEVKGLGRFIEIEAIGKAGEEDALAKQLQHFIDYLNVGPSTFIDQSYSDMIGAVSLGKTDSGN